VTVLEATQEVGGRVRTFRAEDNSWYVELGAMRLPKKHRLVREYLQQFGLQLNPFIQSSPKAWYFINGTRWRAEEVERDPNILGYPVAPSERGKSALKLYRETLGKAFKTFQKMDCKEYLEKYDSFSTKEYLLKVGNLSRGAVDMIGDLLNDDAGFYLSFLSSLWDFDIFSDESFDEITGGFDQLPKAFHTALPGVVQLGCEVKKIHTKDDQVQVVYWNSQENKEATLEADYVLVTSMAKATRLTPARPSPFISPPSHIFLGELGVLLASYTWNDDAAFFTPLSEEQILELVFRDLADIHRLSPERLRRLCPHHVVQKWQLDPQALGAF
ncbi:L-amino-acid oxidase, partial [Dryobates pubescens]